MIGAKTSERDFHLCITAYLRDDVDVSIIKSNYIKKNCTIFIFFSQNCKLHIPAETVQTPYFHYNYRRFCFYKREEEVK